MGTKQENIEASRERNIKTFEATMGFCTNLPSLRAAIDLSLEHTKVYNDEGITISKSWKKDDEHGNITFRSMTTLEAAKDLTHILGEKNHRIGVLDFASATTVGGGTIKGANAQEESLCRISTLYPILSSDKILNEYYIPNRICGTRMYTDRVVYIPDVIVFREDGMKDEEILPESEWYTIDVIVCPAPNLRKDVHNQFDSENNDGVVDISTEEAFNEYHDKLRNRCSRILHVAASNHVTHLVLGAFGCGAFKNPPEIVVEALMHECTSLFMKEFFNEITFAVPKTSYNMDNWNAFSHYITDVYYNAVNAYNEYCEKHKALLDDYHNSFTKFLDSFTIGKF